MSSMAKMKRLRTTNIKEVEVDFRVLKFTCHDDSFLTSVGKHCKELRWLIAVSHDPKPVEVCVTVDKQVIGSPEVHVECNSKQVYPAVDNNKKSRAKLTVDFTWRWPFRGLIRGIQVPNYFEVRPEHLLADAWFPATVNEQMEDGQFKVTAMMPNGAGGFRPIDFPVVRATNLREAHSKSPVDVPQCALVLQVPKNDPMHACLLVENGYNQGDMITHFFARQSPPAPGGLMGARPADPRIVFDVSKDRRLIKANVGYATLTHFLSGQVRTVSRDSPSRLKKNWTIQVGPYATHVVQLEKASQNSKVVTLTVDGEVLCESAAEDIEAREDWWECNFRLTGERFLEWNIHKTNVDGVALPIKGQVVQRTIFSHNCNVSFTDNISEATLYVDNFEYKELPDAVEPTNDQALEMAPEALSGSFGLTAPYQVDSMAPTGMIASFRGAAGEGGGFFDNLFSCCSDPPITRDDVIHPAR